MIHRGETIAAPEGEIPADLAVEDGKMFAAGPGIEGSASEEIDASGLHILSGGIDAHAHFNGPGRANWVVFRQPISRACDPRRIHRKEET